ncbi:UNKNOWN [Stylonychia lemnae]|uniref:Uncharacterized protein n=1 Tax=Stylonychia lemnae TaxID=5949 RepID=A0A077ZRS3_STYLE|nr:UNKNOWN [Stylonychia lemnae]|eukprot:CDW72577.1 UNKNOWN [Stylonychia lemnae]
MLLTIINRIQLWDLVKQRQQQLKEHPNTQVQNYQAGKLQQNQSGGGQANSNLNSQQINQNSNELNNDLDYQLSNPKRAFTNETNFTEQIMSLKHMKAQHKNLMFNVQSSQGQKIQSPLLPVGIKMYQSSLVQKNKNQDKQSAKNLQISLIEKSYEDSVSGSGVVSRFDDMPQQSSDGSPGRQKDKSNEREFYKCSKFRQSQEFENTVKILQKKSKSYKNMPTALQQVEDFFKNDLVPITSVFCQNKYYANNFVLTNADQKELKDQGLNPRVHLKSLVQEQLEKLASIKELEQQKIEDEREKQMQEKRLFQMKSSLINGLMRRISNIKQEEQEKLTHIEIDETDQDLLKLIEDNSLSSRFDMKQHPFYKMYDRNLNLKLKEDLKVKQQKPLDLLQRVSQKSEEFLSKIQVKQLNPKYYEHKKQLDLQNISPQNNQVYRSLMFSHKKTSSNNYIEVQPNQIVTYIRESRNRRYFNSMTRSQTRNRIISVDKQNENKPVKSPQPYEKQDMQRADKIILECLDSVFNEQRIRKLRGYSPKLQ